MTKEMRKLEEQKVTTEIRPTEQEAEGGDQLEGSNGEEEDSDQEFDEEVAQKEKMFDEWGDDYSINEEEEEDEVLNMDFSYF